MGWDARCEIGLVGEVDPEHFRRVLLGQDPYSARQLIASRAPKPVAGMAELATVAALLMGPDGAFITGSDILMDGGVSASYFYGELAPI